MISEATSEVFAARNERSGTQRSTRVLGLGVFAALLGLLLLAVVPFGTSHPWWKAIFVCAAFVMAMLWVVEMLVSGAKRIEGQAVLLPMIALALLAFIQSLTLWQNTAGLAGVRGTMWYAISADPLASRFFALQLAALVLLAAMLYRYVDSERRLRLLTHVIIGTAVASALFGILRQTSQDGFGFGLSAMAHDQGYGQFINKNHFAFLMEMAFGLALGILIGGGVRRERVLIYVGALLPIWTALVLSNSRGGLVAMMGQIVTAALLFPLLSVRHDDGSARRKFVTSWPARVVLLIVLIAGVAVGTLWLGGDRLASSIEKSSEFAPVATELRQNARRNQIWRATWRMFTANPIAGVGMAGYWAAIPTYHDASGTMTPQEAHNDYLELLASGGLIGVGLGVWFVVVAFRRAKGNLLLANGFRRAACFGAVLGLTGVAIHSLFDFGLHMLGNALVCTALVVIATARHDGVRG